MHGIAVALRPKLLLSRLGLGAPALAVAELNAGLVHPHVKASHPVSTPAFGFTRFAHRLRASVGPRQARQSATFALRALRFRARSTATSFGRCRAGCSGVPQSNAAFEPSWKSTSPLPGSGMKPTSGTSTRFTVGRIARIQCASRKSARPICISISLTLGGS